MLWTLLTIGIVLVLGYTLLLRGRVKNPACQNFDGWLYAHRGCFNREETIPENSRAAFRRAVEKGVGVELDVHLLADGGLAVIHDSNLERVTGCTGVVEDLTTDQLAAYHLFGTAETIPTFQEVLEIFQGAAPMIIELKTHNRNTDALCQAVWDAVKDYQGLYCMESFDPSVVYWLRKNHPDIVRGQLAENMCKTKTEVKLNGLMRFGATYLLLNPLTRPDFIAYRYSDRSNLANQICLHIWGMRGVSWTLRSQEELDTARREDLWPIYEGFEPDTAHDYADEERKAESHV